MRLLLEVPAVSPNGAEAVKLRLGGMALRNGLLVHGPTKWAAAVRTSTGEIKIASGAKPRLHGKGRLPEVGLPWEEGRVAPAMIARRALGAGVGGSGPANAGRESAVALLS